MKRVLVFALSVLALATPSSPGEGGYGVVVEQAGPRGSAAVAGIRPGDVLLAWSAADGRGGPLAGPAEVIRLDLEVAPSAELRIAGRRGEEHHLWELGTGPTGLVTRPMLAGEDHELYERGRAAVAEGRPAEGVVSWLQLVSRSRSRGSHGSVVWLAVRIAAAQGATEEALADATELARGAGQEPALAAYLGVVGTTLERAGAFAGAGSAQAWALAAHRHLAAESLGAADALIHLGSVAWHRGDLAASRRFFVGSLALRRCLASGSLQHADSLNNLGLVAWRLGDLQAAEVLLGRTLEIRQRMAPDGVLVAETLGNLGAVEWIRGDLAAAEGFFRRAIDIHERSAPASGAVVFGLNNLGVIATERGELLAAESLFGRVVEIVRERAPGSLDLAGSLSNLGEVAYARGDLDGAEAHYREALRIRESVVPASLELSASLVQLGDLAADRGQLDEAEGLFRRALAIESEQAPESGSLAVALQGLGRVAVERGDLEQAEDSLRRALVIQEQIAPEGLELAEVADDLAVVAELTGSAQRVEELLCHAFAIRSRLAPGSQAAAETGHRLALLYRSQGRDQEALDLFASAVASLESQRRRLGGSDEVRARFGARHAELYRDYLELLLELGRPAEAFHLLERSRARGMLELLAQRELMFTADLPAELDRRRRVLATECERVLEALAEAWREGGPELQDALLRELAAVRRRQQENRHAIRAASPRLAALEDPVALDLAAVQEVLDPGTLLLAYSVGTGSSSLFALEREFFQVFDLGLGDAGLRREALRLRRLMESRDVGVAELAARLGGRLLQPVGRRIEGADRVLVLPDGVLHLVPFAALRIVVGGGRCRYLVEQTPVTVVASATVFAELAERRRARCKPSVVAFGDPDYVAAAATGRGDAAVTGRGTGPVVVEPLPATRTEVEALAELFSDRSQVWLGSEATEERARSVAATASILHFACHAIVDERFPLDSALVLSIPAERRPGQEDGLLRAWEVFESMRLDADLVTLSACATGLGEELAGEGIVGLTRAFHHAGARAVLASLWQVADESTAELMRGFYTGLEAGRPTDEALRSAQLELLRGCDQRDGDEAPQHSHPFHWAAFQLVGDWQ